ncbi:hypothetical protein DFH07DRAFT_380412 [Mycena maculata]|uniref:Uncharacterized protein n=1 Tax=Mycena maculata TaxID=230809 RepID=A0AAD7H856_9AGAR|nr:hypothetical protein DFH07DRAFT_380412 [Mycena maculata]
MRHTTAPLPSTLVNGPCTFTGTSLSSRWCLGNVAIYQPIKCNGARGSGRILCHLYDTVPRIPKPNALGSLFFHKHGPLTNVEFCAVIIIATQQCTIKRTLLPGLWVPCPSECGLVRSIRVYPSGVSAPFSIFGIFINCGPAESVPPYFVTVQVDLSIRNTILVAPERQNPPSRTSSSKVDVLWTPVGRIPKTGSFGNLGHRIAHRDRCHFACCD